MRSPILGNAMQPHEDSTADLSTFFVYKVSLHTHELLQKMYEKKVTVFNRGYIGQVLQLHQECTWFLSTIEKASGTFFKVKGHINFLMNYNLTRILQHMGIPIQQVLDTDNILD